MSKVSFSIDFGNGFSVSQNHGLSRDTPRTTGDFHRLTPEQFDALTGAFDLDNGWNDEEIKTLTIPETGKNFRTVSINMGGLIVTLFSDVTMDVPVEA